MDKKLKAKWVKALRSGEYKQAYSRLKRINARKQASYCCLGVLCEVAKIKSYSTSFIRNLSGDAFIVPEGMQHTLSIMNDDGKSFRFIARFIEKNL